jgi:hypothetical protein
MTLEKIDWSTDRPRHGQTNRLAHSHCCNSRPSLANAPANAKTIVIGRREKTDQVTGTAIENGWSVGRVFNDDAVSGAEVARLKDRRRLLAAIETGPPGQHHLSA